MKKILSIALALALCLTAMMGCFVVSAAANTLAVGTADITVGDATADVVVDITSEGVWAIRFDVKSDVALTAVAIDDANFNAELEGTKVLIQSIENDYANNITAAKITLTFATADLAAGSYAVAIENIDAGNYAEAAVAFDTTAGAIDVAEAVVEPAEPVLDENIKCTFSAGLDATAYIAFIVDTSAVTADYASYDLVVTRNTNDDKMNFKEISNSIVGDDVVFAISATETWYIYYGIELYSLNVPVTAVLNCYDADGNLVAYSNNFTTTLKDVLADTYAIQNPSNAGQKKLMTTITDLVNAAAEVQKFVAPKGSDYAGLELPNIGWDQTYATAALDESKLGSFDSVSNTDIQFYNSAAVAASPTLTFAPYTIADADRANYDLKVSYYDQVKKTTVSTTVNLADAAVIPYDGFCFYDFKDLAIYATNAEVTAEVIADGSVIASSSYCFDKFISSNTVAAVEPALNALGILGQSFRAFNGL